MAGALMRALERPPAYRNAGLEALRRLIAAVSKLLFLAIRGISWTMPARVWKAHPPSDTG